MSKALMGEGEGRGETGGGEVVVFSSLTAQRHSNRSGVRCVWVCVWCVGGGRVEECVCVCVLGGRAGEGCFAFLIDSSAPGKMLAGDIYAEVVYPIPDKVESGELPFQSSCRLIIKISIY